MNRRGETVRDKAEGLRTSGGIDARRAVRVIAPSLIWGICGYFAGLAELPFGARPFGVALLAASGRESILVYLGLVIGAFSSLEVDSALVYFCVYTALILARVFARIFIELRAGGRDRADARKIFSSLLCERVGPRVVISASFGVALGIAMLIGGGLLYYDLFGLFVIALSAPLATFLICGYTARASLSSNSASRGELLSLWRDVGFLAASGIAVYGARESVLYGVSLPVATIIILTFAVTRARGVGYGAMLGLALGLCYSPMLAPLFVISALCAGVLIRFSVTLACFSAFFASCAWAFYVEGMSALLGVFGGILSGCLIYSVLDRIIFVELAKGDDASQKEERTKKALRCECKVLPESVLDGVRLYESNLRASALSDGFYRLSLFVDELKNEKTADLGCGDIYDEKYNNSAENDFDSVDYGALSRLLSRSMESADGEYNVDKTLSERLCSALTALDLDIIGVLVYGVRKRTIYIRAKSKNKLTENTNTIIDAIAPLLPFSIDGEAFDARRDGSEEGGALLLFERKKSSASVVRRRVAAKDENVCGDSVTVFKNRDDRFFAVISDGMGSGRTASVASRICSGFLSNMLSVGGLSKELIVMLNGFLCGRLRSGGLECSATLDILELDLMSGRSALYKCGAAPSYVYRGGRLFKLRSGTMPIGILREVDIKKFELNLSRGDVVVMVSDGVTGESGECPWLFDLLVQNLPSRGLERTADLIVKYASARGSVDDISVVLVRIE